MNHFQAALEFQYLVRFGTFRPPYRLVNIDLVEILQVESCIVVMAPHPGIDTDQIRDKVRRSLFDLLEGVCKGSRIS